MANVLINNEVLGEVIGAELPAKLKFAKVAVVDNTLQGQAGDTIKVEKYGYIGEAQDFTMGQAIPVSDLSTTEKKVTIKQAGKAVQVYDIEIQRRGQEVKDEAVSQIEKALADKIDTDCYKALVAEAVLSYNAAGAKISYEDIVNATSLFEDEDDDSNYSLYIHPTQEADLVLTPGFISSSVGDGIIKEGTIGRLAGCDIISKKVKKVGNVYNNIIIKDGALGIKLGNAVGLEEEREATFKRTKLVGDETYLAYLRDDSACVKLVVTSTPARSKK